MSDWEKQESEHTGAGREGEQAGGHGGGERRAERTFVEEFKVASEDVIAKVKELIREGNVRRISFRNEEGRTLIEIPLTVGVIGTLLLPVWAAIGAVAALVANLTLTVERRGEPNAQGEIRPAGEDESERGANA